MTTNHDNPTTAHEALADVCSCTANLLDLFNEMEPTQRVAIAEQFRSIAGQLLALGYESDADFFTANAYLGLLIVAIENVHRLSDDTPEVHLGNQA